jgi:hypothetical protein
MRDGIAHSIEPAHHSRRDIYNLNYVGTARQLRINDAPKVGVRLGADGASPDAFSKSRFVRAGSRRNLASVFQKTALF